MKKNNNINILITFIGGIAGGILGFIYQFISIYLLSPNELSNFLATISFYTIITIGVNSFGLYITKELGRNQKHINTIFKDFSYLTGFFGLFTFFILIIINPFIVDFLNLNDNRISYIGALLVFMSILLLPQNSYFQTRGDFRIFALLQFTAPLLRILFIGVIGLFTISGFGAINSFVLPFILMYIFQFLFIQKTYFGDGYNLTPTNYDALNSFLSQKKQILQYLFTSIIIALLMNIDILIIKNIFDGETAGYYAAVSVLAKFLVFLGLSIETVYYPQLVKEKKIPTKKILQISGYYLLLILGALGFFYLFGDIVLRLFKGGLQEHIDLIYPLLIFCGLLGYLSIIVKTLIAYERYTINYLLGILIVGLIICIYSFGTTPLLITQIFAIFGFVGLGLGMSQLVRK